MESVKASSVAAKAGRTEVEVVVLGVADANQEGQNVDDGCQLN
jgi:hypothetical protein